MKIPHNNRLAKVLHCGGWLCLVLLVLMTCVRSLYLFPGTSNILTDADLIQLPTMFLDLEVDLGNFWGWKLPDAPYYFPDTAVFLFVNWLVRDSWRSIIAYSLVQTASVVFILCWLHRVIGGKKGAVFLTILLLAILAFTNIYTTTFDRTQGFITPYIYCLSSYIHFGTYICTLFCLAGSLSYLRTRKKLLLVVITAVVFMTTVSDLLFAIYFTVPFVAALTIASKSRILIFDTGIKHFCYIIFSASFLAYIYNKYFDFLAATTTVVIKLRKIILAIETISTDLWQTAVSEQVFLSLAIAFPLFYLIQIAARLYLQKESKKDVDICTWQIITCVYVAIAVILNIMAVVILGKYTTVPHARYLIFVYYTPGLVALIFVSLWLEKIQHIDRLILATTATISIVTLTSMLGQEFPPISRILSPPDYASCFDLDRTQAGLAQYWQSKPLIAFSQRRIQIATIKENGEPATWNSNRYWYTDSWIKPGSLPRFQFIFMKSLEPKAIASRYGKPDRIEACKNSEIWRYDDSTRLYSKLMQDGL